MKGLNRSCVRVLAALLVMFLGLPRPAYSEKASATSVLSPPLSNRPPCRIQYDKSTGRISVTTDMPELEKWFARRNDVEHAQLQKTDRARSPSEREVFSSLRYRWVLMTISLMASQILELSEEHDLDDPAGLLKDAVMDHLRKAKAVAELELEGYDIEGVTAFYGRAKDLRGFVLPVKRRNRHVCDIIYFKGSMYSGKAQEGLSWPVRGDTRLTAVPAQPQKKEPGPAAHAQPPAAKDPLRKKAESIIALNELGIELSGPEKSELSRIRQLRKNGWVPVRILRYIALAAERLKVRLHCGKDVFPVSRDVLSIRPGAELVHTQKKAPGYTVTGKDNKYYILFSELKRTAGIKDLDRHTLRRIGLGLPVVYVAPGSRIVLANHNRIAGAHLAGLPIEALVLGRTATLKEAINKAQLISSSKISVRMWFDPLRRTHNIDLDDWDAPQNQDRPHESGEERSAAGYFYDAVTFVQATSARDLSYIALGTGWIDELQQDITRYHPQHKDLEQLVISLKRFCRKNNIRLITASGDLLLTKIRAHKRKFPDARGLVMAGSATVEEIKEFYESGRTNGGRMVLGGIDHSSLTPDSYYPLMDILSTLIKIYKRPVPEAVTQAEIDRLGISFREISRITTLIFHPRARPMNYRSLRRIYSIQSSA